MCGHNGFVRAFLLLLAFLLPLRVIGAESMALSMTLVGVAVGENQAAEPHHQSIEMDHSMPMDDCPLMVKAEQPPDGTHGHAQGNCHACQICMVWATASTLGRLPQAILEVLKSELAEDFASAAFAPNLRPPIS
jgi:hypothetical protein